MSKNSKPSSATNRTKNHCEICGQIIIGSSYKFKSHLFQHGAIDSRFECTYCLKTFFRIDAYRRHMGAHNGIRGKRSKNGIVKRYICDYCDRGFVDKRNLIYHLKVHDDSFHGRTDIEFKCEACGVVYCENRLLKYHIRKEHFNLQAKEVIHHKKTLNETWVEAVKDSKDYVKITKVNNNTITIKKCLKQEFPQKKGKIVDLSAIYLSRQYAKGICDYCNKEMLKKSLLMHIRERHLNVRKYNCETCKRSFKRHYQMVDHECGKIRRRRKNRQVITEIREICNEEK